MSLSLYDISALSFHQTIEATHVLLEKGLAYFKEKNIDPEAFVETRFYPDMHPFRFQIQSLAHLSVGAIDGLKAGQFRAQPYLPEGNYAALQALIVRTRDTLAKITPEMINAYQDTMVIFDTAAGKLPFKADAYFLSFIVPNFYFHATTAYDMLRSQGVPIGKRHFLGRLRFER